MAGGSSVSNLQYIETERQRKEVERQRNKETEMGEGAEMDTEEETETLGTTGHSVQIWMRNLVREAGRGERVFLLGRSCMDRFLSAIEEVESLKAWSQSRLLAAACLLVTSKIFSEDSLSKEELSNSSPKTKENAAPKPPATEKKPLAARELIKFAGNTFGMQELLDCELLLLSKLGWDVYLGCHLDHDTDLPQLDNLNFSPPSAS